ncbi:hypothetical protein [Nocardioides alcanivorans]|uniref:hypothetical protein n=1 Tax=Nocardioides alcanivorans TaxID=2897352 RepID=UPI001F3E88B3|nr:hypothetical protein [Nocardioides alcanivorans]
MVEEDSAGADVESHASMPRKTDRRSRRLAELDGAREQRCGPFLNYSAVDVTSEERDRRRSP